MRFGICLTPTPPIKRTVQLAELAEASGFDYVWLLDSPVLWQNIYPILALMADRTERIRMGPCVTNPISREPCITASALATLNEISGGRIDLGIGRGDSAVRVVGKRPATIAALERAVVTIRDLAEGRTAQLGEAEATIEWAEGTLPVWVSGYGPKALGVAGRVADGVVLQPAVPALIRWSLGHVHEAVRQAGRGVEDVEVMCLVPAFVGDDLPYARSQVRWFPAMASNQVVELIERHGPDGLPDDLVAYVAGRGAYDYRDHGKLDATHNQFVTDDVTDRFCVIGPAAECIRRIEELADSGVQQFNAYAQVDDPEHLIRTLGRDVIPAFRA
jgi:probable F420-dependent oxidoreductase